MCPEKCQLDPIQNPGGNKISNNLWLWLKGHNFTSLISVFGKKGLDKFSHNKGNLLAFGEVAGASAYPAEDG